VVAATAVETIDAGPVIDALRDGRARGLALALAAAARIDDVLMLEQMIRLGSLTAYERVAHLLLELQHRLEIVGQGDAQRFPLPLTQEMLGELLGISIVHINRILKQLRREGLIELRSGVAVLLQREALIALTDFKWPGPAAESSMSAWLSDPPSETQRLATRPSRPTARRSEPAARRRGHRCPRADATHPGPGQR
jgi:hypothetical protein